MAYDCVGGAVGADVCALTFGDGVLVHYGLLSGRPLPARCFTEPGGPRVELFRLRDTVHRDGRRHPPELFAPVFEQMRRGLLRTAVTHRVGLSALAGDFQAPAVGTEAERS
ncbi:hypothetical protein ACFYOR_16660 [Streptomyces griseofuscus]|uniref:hypothetical protein n=1 Tax=Streptomyces griseofuscus TaxID=146922 RepID=UPI0036825C9D